MSKPAKGGALSADLSACLDQIKPSNGYNTDVAKVYGPTDRVAQNAGMPYILVRPAADSRTGLANGEASRVKSYEIEGVFSKAATEAELCNLHVDVLRALGIGQDLFERKFPGLVEDVDEASYRWAQGGETTHSITILIGVNYVERYN